MSNFKKIMNTIAKVENAMMAVCTLAILVLIFVNVIGRFVFNHSFAFVDEFVVAVFVLVSLTGAALASRKDGGLIGLSLLSDSLKGNARRCQKLCANIVSILYCGVLTYEGALRVATDYSRGLHTFVLHWPQWIFSAFVPVAGVFLVLHLVENTIDFFENKNAPAEQNLSAQEVY